MFLFKCDKDKFSPMLAKVQTDHVGGQDAFPSTCLAAYVLINNWNNMYGRRVPSIPSHYGLLFVQFGYVLEYDDTDNDVNKESGQDCNKDDMWKEVLQKRQREPLKMQILVKCNMRTAKNKRKHSSEV
jgi:hypothetical protein